MIFRAVSALMGVRLISLWMWNPQDLLVQA
jgi:hypothetical protein